MKNENLRKKIANNGQIRVLKDHTYTKRLNEIFNIIKQDTDKYTINKYGVHINMNKLADSTLEKLEKFINFSNLNKEKLRNGNLERNKILEIIGKQDVRGEYQAFKNSKVINL